MTDQLAKAPTADEIAAMADRGENVARFFTGKGVVMPGIKDHGAAAIEQVSVFKKGMPVIEEYLGDGVYAVFEGYDIELYVSDGITKTNRVFLEPEVLAAFLKYVERLKAKTAVESQ